MSYLITREQQQIPHDLRRLLDTKAHTAYCPLRELVSKTLDGAELQTLMNSERLVLTSHFALSTFVKQYATEWVSQHPDGQLIVLSSAMAAMARAAGVTNVCISQQENGQSLMLFLAELQAREPVRNTLMLVGNLHASKHTGIRTLVIYENLWTPEQQEHDRRMIVQYTQSYGPFTKLLVTSSSAFRRLSRVEQETPESFAHPEYFVLGHGTEEAIHRAGIAAFTPGSNTNVLRQSIKQWLAQSRL